MNFSTLRYFGHRALRPLWESGEPRALLGQHKTPTGFAAASEFETEIAGIKGRSDKAAGKARPRLRAPAHRRCRPRYRRPTLRHSRQSSRRLSAMI